MSDAAGDPYVKLTISPDNGLGFILDRMEASEELGRPFTIVLDVSSEKPKGDLHSLLGASATVKLSFPQKADRFFNGVVSRVNYRGLSGGGYKYRVELRPWIWLLAQHQDCRIFSAKSAWTIMTELFRDAGFTDFQDKRQNGSGDLVLDYCVQYRETTLDFVTRLMEQFGIYYFVTHSDGTHTINFADDSNSHTAVRTAIPYEYNQANWRHTDDHVWDWNAEAQIQPGAYTVREYNFTTPKADLTAKSIGAGGHTYGSSEVYDYPGLYDTANDGTTLANVRMQDFATRRQIYGGTSNSRALGTGAKFTLSNFPDTAANQEYLVIESVCSVERSETRATTKQEQTADSFRCVLRAVPGSRPFRLPNLTPRPFVHGPQTAKVVGESGQEVTTDQYGRIKVKFPWDRRTTEDENSSCWIRVAQVWAGKAWGGMVIPRIGQEVVVEFLEGNPDRPLVTGTVYNADQTVPYGLPDNKTRSTFKTNSSLNGGGFNELRFEDKKDSEEVFFQAQKDFNEVVLNNHTAKIKQDTTTTVQEGNRAVTISKGNDTLTITEGKRDTTIKGNDTTTIQTGNHATTVSQGDHSTTVSQGKREATISTGNDSITVSTGNHTITVSAGTSTIEAAQKITLKVGPSSLELTPSGITAKIGPSSVELTMAGVTVKGAQTKVEGTGQAELTGAAVTVQANAALQLKGGAIASLEGPLVKIN